jgi:hypothetical protein
MYKRFLSVMAAAGVIALAPLSRADATGYKQTNLVSDKNAAAAAAFHDADLLNPCFDSLSIVERGFARAVIRDPKRAGGEERDSPAEIASLPLP